MCVVHDGQTVVDIWGGTIDDDGTPWAEDTIINVWSTTKTMTFLTALLLADRGELDFHAPVARYWPEFAANGKEAIEVRHLMAHTAGLAGWVEPIEEADLYDWEKATSLLAAQAPAVGARHRVRATTPSRRATSSVRSSGGSPAARPSASSSPRRSPGRSAPTSTSAPAPSTTTGSPW